MEIESFYGVHGMYCEAQHLVAAAALLYLVGTSRVAPFGAT